MRLKEFVFSSSPGNLVEWSRGNTCTHTIYFIVVATKIKEVSTNVWERVSLIDY